jgi:hypothetical protein
MDQIKLAWHAVIGLADQGKDIVFGFIIEYGSFYVVGLFLYKDF